MKEEEVGRAFVITKGGDERCVDFSRKTRRDAVTRET
jgi:hypothetical protein